MTPRTALPPARTTNRTTARTAPPHRTTARTAPPLVPHHRRTAPPPYRTTAVPHHRRTAPPLVPHHRTTAPGMHRLPVRPACRSQPSTTGGPAHEGISGSCCPHVWVVGPVRRPLGASSRQRNRWVGTSLIACPQPPRQPRSTSTCPHRPDRRPTNRPTDAIPTTAGVPPTAPPVGRRPLSRRPGYPLAWWVLHCYMQGEPCTRGDNPGCADSARGGLEGSVRLSRGTPAVSGIASSRGVWLVTGTSSRGSRLRLAGVDTPKSTIRGTWATEGERSTEQPNPPTHASQEPDIRLSVGWVCVAGGDLQTGCTPATHPAPIQLCRL